MLKTKKRVRSAILKNRKMFLAGVSAAGLFSLMYFSSPALVSKTYRASGENLATTTAMAEQKPAIVHLTTPNPVKGIYMSQCVAGTPSFRNSLVKLVEDTELNTIVIDIRDYTGKIAFPTDNPALKNAVSGACGARDMRTFIGELHEKGIYVVGRITVFQNPYYTSIHPEQAVQHKDGGVWKDYKGLAFVDVGARPYWDNIIELGKEAYELGFDELNFDYIRFPSDRPMSKAVYSWDTGKSKPQVLEEFFKYLADGLRPTGAVLSADLFGMAATNSDDLNIGQVLERALPYFDYVSPMVYPSHYPAGFNGYKNVNAHSYDIVHLAMRVAVERTVAATTTVPSLNAVAIASTTPQLYEKAVYPASKIRQWLQRFDYPVDYTPDMVRAQIQATEDAGLTSWLFWDAANKYASLEKTLLQKATSAQ